MGTHTNPPVRKLYASDTSLVYDMLDIRLPDTALSDNGKVPVVNQDGDFAYATPPVRVNRAIVLTEDVSMSDIVGYGEFFCSNIWLTASSSRIITVDTPDGYVVRFVLSNTSSSDIAFEFDFSGLGITDFAGESQYINASSLVIPVPANSNMTLNYSVTGDEIVSFDVAQVAATAIPVS